MANPRSSLQAGADPGPASSSLKPPPTVRAWTESLVLPTYLPAAPDRNPMFLEQRVYQGSSGRVYPLPCTDRIAEQPVERAWKAVWIENQFLRVLVLPELGGRIHRILDRTNNYDLIYYQPVIKPALVGLAGPWASGGIEFNWPQHHRPATFLPVDFELEHHPDGGATLWCSDHDPMSRMKGMHGVCLHPDRAYLELKVRVHNRTPFVQTFLWWANVATRVHAAYQSFFPPDVTCVADHARRSMSSYPLAQGSYYDVDYARRGRGGIPRNEVPAQYIPPHCRGASAIGNQASGSRRRKPGSQMPDAGGRIPAYAPNDLSFYANIPVPTSYMCVGSREDFFGGYDHQAEAGIVHLASHHIAPGKKQWTWGNHEFGYAWDRNLTDPDVRGESAPYIEIMAGVYTDNQPDFSFLQPGETRSWSQYWYPIQQIGPAHHANLDAAVSLRLERKRFRVGVSTTAAFPRARVRLERAGGSAVAEWRADLAPGRPFVLESPQTANAWKVGETVLRVVSREGREILAYAPRPPAQTEVPAPASEPPAPSAVASADELFVTGLHLDQYRHATRCPTLYWREALRRDPLDSRCNNAVGRWHLQRGEFELAEAHFRRVIQRLTRRNANPYDGEPYYNLGLCLRFQADALAGGEERARRGADLLTAAYDAFYKATWNQSWAGAAYHALAEIDCRRGDWVKAREHCERAARAGGEDSRVMNLWALVLARTGNATGSEAMLRLNRARDPLDWWTRHLLGEPLTCDLQTCLDLAHDYARAGFYAEAAALLEARLKERDQAPLSRSPGARARERGEAPHELPDQSLGARPLVHYTLGWLCERLAVLPGTGCSPNFALPRQHKVGQRRRALDYVHRALRHYRCAAAAAPDCCFPARLEEIAVLEAAMRANPHDARAPYYLGNLLYDRRRHDEAIRCWERSAQRDPGFSVVWRNLGLGYFNVRRQPAKARAAYDQAFRANPVDARLLYERDQLWKRLGMAPSRRLRELERWPALVRQRDDLSIELCALYNQTARPGKALELLRSRHFQPWEGGEGGPLGQWVRSNVALGRQALAAGDATGARERFEAALTGPPNLGEAGHLLANQSDVHYWLGCACHALADHRAARREWLLAARFKGDFQQMRVRAFSEMTYYSALAWRSLGLPAKATKLFRELQDHARQLERTPAHVDYFATSLPTMLLFADDLQFRQTTTARFLQAQASLGLGQRARGRTLLRDVLRRDPNHPQAGDLLAELAAAAKATTIDRFPH